MATANYQPSKNYTNAEIRNMTAEEIRNMSAQDSRNLTKEQIQIARQIIGFENVQERGLAEAQQSFENQHGSSSMTVEEGREIEREKDRDENPNEFAPTSNPNVGVRPVSGNGTGDKWTDGDQDKYQERVDELRDKGYSNEKINDILESVSGGNSQPTGSQYVHENEGGRGEHTDGSQGNSAGNSVSVGSTVTKPAKETFKSTDGKFYDTLAKALAADNAYKIKNASSILDKIQNKDGKLTDAELATLNEFNNSQEISLSDQHRVTDIYYDYLDNENISLEDRLSAANTIKDNYWIERLEEEIVKDKKLNNIKDSVAKDMDLLNQIENKGGKLTDAELLKLNEFSSSPYFSLSDRHRANDIYSDYLNNENISLEDRLSAANILNDDDARKANWVDRLEKEMFQGGASSFLDYIENKDGKLTDSELEKVKDLKINSNTSLKDRHRITSIYSDYLNNENVSLEDRLNATNTMVDDDYKDYWVERLEKEITVVEKAEAAAAKAEKDRLDKIEADKLAKEEADRQDAIEKAYQDKLEAAQKEEADRQIEIERQEAEQAEQDRLAQIEADRVAAEKAEQDRIYQEELEAAAQKAEEERFAEAERKYQEQLDAAQKAKEEADRQKAEQAEQDRIKAEQEESFRQDLFDKIGNTDLPLEERLEAANNYEDGWYKNFMTEKLQNEINRKDTLTQQAQAQIEKDRVEAEKQQEQSFWGVDYGSVEQKNKVEQAFSGLYDRINSGKYDIDQAYVDDLANTLGDNGAAIKAVNDALQQYSSNMVNYENRINQLIDLANNGALDDDEKAELQDIVDNGKLHSEYAQGALTSNQDFSNYNNKDARVGEILGEIGLNNENDFGTEFLNENKMNKLKETLVNEDNPYAKAKLEELIGEHEVEMQARADIENPDLTPQQRYEAGQRLKDSDLKDSVLPTLKQGVDRANGENKFRELAKIQETRPLTDKEISDFTNSDEGKFFKGVLDIGNEFAVYNKDQQDASDRLKEIQKTRPLTDKEITDFANQYPLSVELGGITAKNEQLTGDKSITEKIMSGAKNIGSKLLDGLTEIGNFLKDETLNDLNKFKTVGNWLINNPLVLGILTTPGKEVQLPGTSDEDMKLIVDGRNNALNMFSLMTGPGMGPSAPGGGGTGALATGTGGLIGIDVVGNLLSLASGQGGTVDGEYQKATTPPSISGTITMENGQSFLPSNPYSGGLTLEGGSSIGDFYVENAVLPEEVGKPVSIEEYVPTDATKPSFEIGQEAYNFKIKEIEEQEERIQNVIGQAEAGETYMPPTYLDQLTDHLGKLEEQKNTVTTEYEATQSTTTSVPNAPQLVEPERENERPENGEYAPSQPNQLPIDVNQAQVKPDETSAPITSGQVGTTPNAGYTPTTETFTPSQPFEVGNVNQAQVRPDETNTPIYTGQVGTVPNAGYDIPSETYTPTQPVQAPTDINQQQYKKPETNVYLQSGQASSTPVSGYTPTTEEYTPTAINELPTFPESIAIPPQTNAQIMPSVVTDQKEVSTPNAGYGIPSETYAPQQPLQIPTTEQVNKPQVKPDETNTPITTGQAGTVSAGNVSEDLNPNRYGTPQTDLGQPQQVAIPQETNTPVYSSYTPVDNGLEDTTSETFTPSQPNAVPVHPNQVAIPSETNTVIDPGFATEQGEMSTPVAGYSPSVDTYVPDQPNTIIEQPTQVAIPTETNVSTGSGQLGTTPNAGYSPSSETYVPSPPLQIPTDVNQAQIKKPETNAPITSGQVGTIPNPNYNIPSETYTPTQPIDGATGINMPQTRPSETNTTTYAGYSPSDGSLSSTQETFTPNVETEIPTHPNQVAIPDETEHKFEYVEPVIDTGGQEPAPLQPTHTGEGQTEAPFLPGTNTGGQVEAPYLPETNTGGQTEAPYIPGQGAGNVTTSEGESSTPTPTGEGSSTPTGTPSGEGSTEATEESTPVSGSTDVEVGGTDAAVEPKPKPEEETPTVPGSIQGVGPEETTEAGGGGGESTETQTPDKTTTEGDKGTTEEITEDKDTSKEEDKTEDKIDEKEETEEKDKTEEEDKTDEKDKTEEKAKEEDKAKEETNVDAATEVGTNTPVTLPTPTFPSPTTENTDEGVDIQEAIEEILEELEKNEEPKEPGWVPSGTSRSPKLFNSFVQDQRSLIQAQEGGKNVADRYGDLGAVTTNEQATKSTIEKVSDMITHAAQNWDWEKQNEEALEALVDEIMNL